MRILMPTDLSEQSQRAATGVRLFAEASDASLELYHVVPDETAWIHGAAGGIAPSLPDWSDDARQLMEEQRSAFGDLDVTCTVERGGDPVPRILERADAIEADCIAMATHGYGGLYDLVLGSTARDLVHSSDRSLLLFPVRENQVPALGDGPLLIATDLSQESGQIVEDAKKTADALGRRLMCATAVQHRDFGPYGTLTAKRAREELGNEVLIGRKQLLRDWANAYGLDGDTPIDVRLVERAADALLSAAEEHDAALIALATHGRSGPARWLLGSVGETVLRRSTRPVLLRRFH